MTIVATEDTRNSDWTKSNVGSKLLAKMGWSEGEGLGKRRQGTSHALRAVRRTDDALGIGASVSDSTGSQGWDQNVGNFATVLQNLKQHHGESDDDGKKKKKRKRKKKELVLAQNKVSAGHARKMRDAKNLSDKSDYDLAAIFGTKPPSANREDSQAVSAANIEEKNLKREKKRKRKRKEEAEGVEETGIKKKSEKKRDKKEAKK